MQSVQPSPRGDRLLTSDVQYAGLTIVDVKSGGQLTLSDAPRAGFRAAWVDDGHVARRVPQAPFGGQPLIELDAVTGDFVGPFFEHHTLGVKQDDVTGAIVVGRRLDDQGTLAQPRQLSPVGETCFAPQLAAGVDHVVVAFQCLTSGLWAVRLDGRDGDGASHAVRFGRGAQLALARDGRSAVFTVMTDEGHVITASDVVVVDLDDLAANRARAIRYTSAAIERAPGISDVQADGSRVLAFVVGDGDIALQVLDGAKVRR